MVPINVNGLVARLLRLYRCMVRCTAITVPLCGPVGIVTGYLRGIPSAHAPAFARRTEWRKEVKVFAAGAPRSKCSRLLPDALLSLCLLLEVLLGFCGKRRYLEVSSIAS